MVMNLLQSMAAIGLRFDIDKAGGGAYGFECWKILWRAVDVQVLTGAFLFDCDTEATFRGAENVFCIVVATIDDSALTGVRHALCASEEFGKVCATPMLVEKPALFVEPLCSSGSVTRSGKIIDDSGWAGAALEAVRQERQGASCH